MSKRKIILILIILLSIFSFSAPSAYFKGFVFDRKSKYPIVNAQIECSGKMTFTDKKGFFELKNIIIGNSIIKITSDEYKDYIDLIKIQHGSNSQNFFIDPKPKMVKVRGIIENEDTGLGISNINISFDNIMSQTDDYGEFYINNIVPQKYIVKVQHPDYEKYLEELTVNDADINNFKIFLKPLVRYGKIIGEIRNMEGELINNAQVSIGINSAVNISGGKFVFDDIVRGKYKIVVYSDGYEPYEENIIVEESTPFRIRMKKDKEFRFSEFEKHRKKENNKGKKVLSKVKGSLEGYVRDSNSMEYLSGITLAISDKHTVTDKNGMYYFHDLEPGDHILNVISSEYGVFNADIVIKPGAGIFNISLNKEDKDSVIFGKVYDKKTQRPVIGATVVAGNDKAKTDEKGFFKFKVDYDDYVELKVMIGNILFYRKIVYINSTKVKNDIFLEVE